MPGSKPPGCAQGHLRLVLATIVYNAMAQKACLRSLPLFRALAAAMRASTYSPLLTHPPADLAAKAEPGCVNTVGTLAPVGLGGAWPTAQPRCPPALVAAVLDAVGRHAHLQLAAHPPAGGPRGQS